MGGEACSSSLVLSIFLIINKILLVVKVALPIIIIAMTTFDIIKDVTGSKVEFKSSLTKVKYRLLAAILIFLVPSMIGVIFRAVDTDYSKNNLECLLNVTSEDYQSALNAECAEFAERIRLATEANTYMEQTVVDEAYLVCNKIEDKELYEKYNKELTEVVKLRDDKFDEVWKKQQEGYQQGIVQQEQEEAEKGHTLPNLELGTSKGGVNFDRPFTGAKMKYYSQNGNYGAIHYKYKNAEYNYNTSGCGCGYVSLSMIVDSLTGSNYYPTGIINNFPPKEYGSCAIADATLKDTTGKIKKDYGLSVRLIYDRNYYEGKQTDSMKKEIKEKLVEALKQGESVILLIPLHYIVLAAIDANDNIAVHDPSNSNNNGWFTIDQIYDYHEDHASFCSVGRQQEDKNGKKMYDSNGNPIMYHRCGFQMAIAYKGPNSISSLSKYYQIYGNANDKRKQNNKVTLEEQ